MKWLLVCGAGIYCFTNPHQKNPTKLACQTAGIHLLLKVQRYTKRNQRCCLVVSCLYLVVCGITLAQSSQWACFSGEVVLQWTHSPGDQSQFFCHHTDSKELSLQMFQAASLNSNYMPNTVLKDLRRMANILEVNNHGFLHGDAPCTILVVKIIHRSIRGLYHTWGTRKYTSTLTGTVKNGFGKQSFSCQISASNRQALLVLY